MRLTPEDHDRDAVGRKHVYPVVSRRARGVSVGVNLNTNQACNWRCVYCQVPGLVRGKAPEVDLELLARELHEFLDELFSPGWLERHAPPEARRVNDLALSGNGEPTLSPQFEGAVECMARELERRELVGRVRLILITNGSGVSTPGVQAGLARMASVGGEVWFKLDGAQDSTLARVNDVRTSVELQRKRLLETARLCPTWVQTIALDFEGPSPSVSERVAYADLLSGVLAEGVSLRGVLLYGLARESHQPEAARLRSLPVEDLEAFGALVRERTGLEVRVSP